MFSTLFWKPFAMFHIFSPRMLVQMPAGWLQPTLSTPNKKINTTLALKEAEAPNGISCPYEYILNLYGKNGKNHFEKIIRWLDPALEEEDPAWFALILEIMDVVHFGLILVDDVEDNSRLRKGRPAAHMVYGSAETINRSYLRIFQVVQKCIAVKPSAVPFLLDNLTQIHKGQDDSLVWRRDGFDIGVDEKTALDQYREMASLKTGALFRLVGQLVTGSHVHDESMTKFGWYGQLQNDCKNVFSSDAFASKGAMAEDLANGEYSYPILVALYADVEVSMAVEDVLRRCRQGETGRPFGALVSNATLLMQRDGVRARCLRELDELREQNRGFASLWGRKEEMVVDTASLKDGDGNGTSGRVPSKRGFLEKVLYSWYG